MAEAALEFEPLLDSEEAAKLLGNIHVKTLQRYARQGSLPGYRIGGHWYFRASDLDPWLRSQSKFNLLPVPRELGGITNVQASTVSVRVAGKKHRRRGPDVWVWNDRSKASSGGRKENSVIVGTVLKYPARSRGLEGDRRNAPFDQ